MAVILPFKPRAKQKGTVSPGQLNNYPDLRHAGPLTSAGKNLDYLSITSWLSARGKKQAGKMNGALAGNGQQFQQH